MRTDLRVLAATSARVPIGNASHDRLRSRFLRIAHPRRGVTLVDGGAGSALVPRRLRGTNRVHLLTPWDLLAALDVPPARIRHAVLTGIAPDRLCNLERLPPDVPIYTDPTILRHVTARVSRLAGRLTATAPTRLLGRARDALVTIDTLPPAAWSGIGGNDLFGDGSCLLLRISEAEGGAIALLMPRVERIAEPVLYITHPSFRFAGADRAHALANLPGLLKDIMALGCRVLHAADPDPSPIDIVEA